jgi:integrase
MNDENDDIYLSTTPPEIGAAAQSVTRNLLPEKSKELYEKRYDLFMDWCKKNGTVRISESVLLVYLSQQSQVCSPNYLWSMYSMLKATILVKHNIDISNYTKVIAFLKKKNVGYQPKKAKPFTNEEINKFLISAPDDEFLQHKVSLILGICGACRTNELVNLTINDIEDRDSVLVVNIHDSKTNKGRVFTVTNGSQQEIDYLYFCRKYMNLRPKNATSPRLFLLYKKGKCVNQVVGKNTLSKTPMIIAQYLKLPNPNLYTGHALRRTSATLLVNAGGSMTQLKRHGGWKSNSVAEGYIEENMTNKIQTTNKILSQTTSNINSNHTITRPMPVAATQQQIQSSSTSLVSTPNTVFQNCDGCTITVNNYFQK